MTETKRRKKETAPIRLKLLVTVVNREKAEFYLDFLNSFEVNFQTSVLGKGTADTETLQLLGIADTQKAVIFSVITEKRAAEALEALESKFENIRGGKGIASTVPLSSTVGVTVYKFLSNNREGETKWNSPTK